MNTEYSEILKKSFPFSELSDDQLLKISEVSKTQAFPKGEIIFNEGDLCRGLYVLLTGLIKVYVLSKSGRQSVIHIVEPVNMFADVAIFGGDTYPVTTEAIEKSEVLFISKEKFLAVIKDNQEITLKMLGGYARRMKSLVAQVENLSSKEVVNRLAKYLFKEVKKNETDGLPEPFVKLTVPKSVIASYIGTITETLSRTLNKLQKEKIIRVQKDKVFITDLATLKKLASE